jgi:predicted dienelactone hydrolase
MQEGWAGKLPIPRWVPGDLVRNPPAGGQPIHLSFDLVLAIASHLGSAYNGDVGMYNTQERKGKMYSPRIRLQTVGFFVVLFSFTLGACQQVPEVFPTQTSIPTPAGTPTPYWVIPSASFPLAEPGPYLSYRDMDHLYRDRQRDGREISFTIWYPIKDDKPDFSGAPYPVILSSTKVANIFAEHLVSHGFVVVSIDKIDTYMSWDQNLIDQPLDILFALNQVTGDLPKGLDGLMDTNHAGVMGYSFDGYNSLALSGARVDPAFFLERCADTSDLPMEISVLGSVYCPLAAEWEQFAAHAGKKLTTSDDGLWQPMTDSRIRAVMPMAGEGSWLFGDKGIAAIDRPVLMLCGTEDDLYSESKTIYEHLGTPDKTLISFIGREHLMILEDQEVLLMKHFAVAFFGHRLQRRADYAQYYSQDFVNQYKDLFWGVYTGK